MMGQAQVYLDGVPGPLVDLYHPTPQYQVVLQKTGLSPGAHVLTIEVTPWANPEATNTIISIDALEVVP